MRYDSTSESQAVHFPGLAVELDEDEYRRQVVAFAESAKQLFEGVDKEPDIDRELYEEFWQEYDRRLGRPVG